MIINELQITNVYGNTFSSASCNVDNIYKRTGDKNIYELVIDNLMLVKYSNDTDLMNYIKSLPLHKKRLAILSLMDDDQYSWDKLREKITGNKMKYTYSETNRIGDHIWYISDLSKFKSDYPEWNWKFGLNETLEQMFNEITVRS